MKLPPKAKKIRYVEDMPVGCTRWVKANAIGLDGEGRVAIDTDRRAFRTPIDGMVRVRMTEDGLKLTIPRWLKLERDFDANQLVAAVYQRRALGLRAHSVGEQVDL